MKFINILFMRFIEFIHTFCLYVEARFLIEVHMTPDEIQNMINALRLC